MKNKTNTVVFESVDAFLTQAQKPATKGNDPHSSKPTTGPRSTWDMGADWDETLRLARDGWAKGLKRITDKRELLEIPESSDKSIQPQPIPAQAGDEVDVGLYLSGEPECMIEYQPEIIPSFGKVARIIVNLTSSCNVKAETYFQRGAAASLLVDALENCGIRCEVWGVFAYGGYGRRNNLINSHWWVPVKAADEPLEMDRLAFLLAHPATFRRLSFRLIEQLPRKQFKDNHESGYGSCMEIPTEEREADGTIYFDRQHSGYRTPEEMQKAIDDTLSKFLGEEVAA
tara:strand:+ start:62 stop:919 length:858 start_codon:yes stop_codon:yes gene_type:complete